MFGKDCCQLKLASLLILLSFFIVYASLLPIGFSTLGRRNKYANDFFFGINYICEWFSEWNCCYLINECNEYFSDNVEVHFLFKLSCSA